MIELMDAVVFLGALVLMLELPDGSPQRPHRAPPDDAHGDDPGLVSLDDWRRHRARGTRQSPFASR